MIQMLSKKFKIFSNSKNRSRKFKWIGMISKTRELSLILLQWKKYNPIKLIIYNTFIIMLISYKQVERLKMKLLF